ncbi:dTMP kinase [Vibrio alginolyticus]|uniref:dTMP kinase n=1 Tax=Vibrio alginolyticus TaxID=663 RepID=UPI001EEE3C4E|nr:AAA family ATPase [Vibrio alginolyticus]EGQ8984618.1 AAA family ATPase [Vibrio alginolyticus]EII3282790.1 AAA family ATPase [Vibrio alginolyticus]ELB2736572.1 AAA family ATPase [Vibrio alginolyticus]ELB2758687.1 AAA family ATPase [Vibrio alginolyticus]ELB2766028.1 AAA family ATPase [Vibrio alginolyticus]
MFIVIEGLDGSGKSTVSKHLAEKLNAKLLTTPGAGFKEVRKQLDTVFEHNPKARQLFYMATVLNVASEAQRFIDSGQNVVVDRYWLSTQVYHHWMSNGQCYTLDEVESELLAPDLTVYLDLPVDERIARINNRNYCTREDKQTLTEQANDGLRSLYIGTCDGKPVGKWLMVDASQSVNSIVDNILSSVCKNL